MPQLTASVGRRCHGVHAHWLHRHHHRAPLGALQHSQDRRLPQQHCYSQAILNIITDGTLIAPAIPTSHSLHMVLTGKGDSAGSILALQALSALRHADGEGLGVAEGGKVSLLVELGMMVLQVGKWVGGKLSVLVDDGYKTHNSF